MTNINELLRKINKDEGYIFRARDLEEPDRVSTGLLRIDTLLKGGWPLKRTVTVYGRYGSGKSSLAMYTVADAQQRGMNVLWIDTEYSFESEWASMIGVKADELLVIENRSLEHILEIVDKLKEGGVEFDVIVVDSISMVNSIKYFDEDQHGIGGQAKATKELVSKLRYWYPGSLIMCLSQLTSKWNGQGFSPGPTGGYSLEHESAFLLQLTYMNSGQKESTVKTGDRLVTHGVEWVDMSWKFLKARSPEVGARGTYRFVPGFGVDRVTEISTEAILSGVVEKNSKWHSFGELKWDGKENFIAELKSNEELLKEVRDAVFKRGGEFIEFGGDGEDSSPETD